MGSITRRSLIVSAGIAAPALLRSRFAAAASASNFPFKPIRFIIPYAPGGGFDVYVRMIAPVMEQFLPRKVAIIPLNVSGGGGARGVIQLYRARPDGYTLGIFNIPGVFILQQQQGSESAYDLEKFAWIGAMGEGEHYVLAVGVDSPLKSFDDLKALSAERPVKFSATGPEGTAYAATVIGTKLLGLRSQLITGYRSSADYVVAAIRGDSDAVIAGYPTAMRFVRGNQIRVLASFRKDAMPPGTPDATTLGQPDLDQIRIERVVGAPPGLPLELRSILSNALAKAVIDPKVVAWAKENDVVMLPKTAPQTAALVGQQRLFFEKWKSFLATG
jgi:tripartite-type tricarboxylate transporter receptor subunit TctC